MDLRPALGVECGIATRAYPWGQRGAQEAPRFTTADARGQGIERGRTQEVRRTQSLDTRGPLVLRTCRVEALPRKRRGASDLRGS